MQSIHLTIVHQILFTLPIRNWNIKIVEDDVEVKQTFYATYKELKHQNEATKIIDWLIEFQSLL